MAKTRSSSPVLFSFKGIKVIMHWSFPLLLIWVLVSSLMRGNGYEEAAFQAFYVILVFACVVLHEFGHALTALHFNVRTKSILLLPIGGVASLERIPDVPRQELLITLAGPAVNAVIALLGGIVYALTGPGFTMPDLTADPVTARTLVGMLVLTNVGLFIFNLLPAFPMDGGRILRSLLAMRTDRVRATRIAATVGRICAVGFVLLALFFQQMFLGLIGVFVFIGAGAEERMVTTQAALRGIQVVRAMRTRFWRMPLEATVQKAVQELLDGGDVAVVATREGAYDRVIAREELGLALQEGGAERTLDTIAGTHPPVISPQDDVRSAYDRLMEGGWSLLPVVENGQLRGVVDQENLAELLMITKAKAASNTMGDR